MRTLHFVISFLTAAFFLSITFVSAQAENEKNVDSFFVSSEITGCNSDMKEHCQGVTPGKNRPLFCLIAFEDQLSNECKSSIVEAMIATRMGTAALDYAYESCGEDRKNICGNVSVGEGRLLKCMKDNEAKISAPCITALKEIGFWEANIEPSSGN